MQSGDRTAGPLSSPGTPPWVFPLNRAEGQWGVRPPGGSLPWQLWETHTRARTRAHTHTHTCCLSRGEAGGRKSRSKSRLQDLHQAPAPTAGKGGKTRLAVGIRAPRGRSGPGTGHGGLCTGVPTWRTETVTTLPGTRNIYTSVRPNTWAPELSPTDPSTEPPQLHQPKERTTARQDWMVEGEWESHEKLTSPHCEQQSGDDTPPPTSAPRPSAGCWGATARPRHRKVSPTAPAAKCTEPDREAGEGERGAKEAGAAHSGESRAQVGDQDAGGRPGHQRLQRRVRPDGGHSSTPGKLCLPAPVPGSSTRARPGRSGHCGSGTPGRHAKQPAAQPHGRPHPAPLGVSQNLVANPVSNLVLPEAQRVRLTEPFRGCPSGPHPSAGAGPAGTTKVNDPRGPRGTETSRKSMVELERKLAHRKISKFPDSPRESRQLAWERLVGEIAFQLDRRILSSIFPERVRLYGFTVSNIPEKIIQASLNPSDHKLDEELCQTLTQRYVGIMNRLQSLGYDGRVHPALTEQLVNAYGILRERPELAASEGGSYTVDFLQRVLVETVHPSMLTDALLLLSCLNQLAHDDGKPMFIW
ncbi:speriolin isoform X4 [Acinonyx jubatus]|uniref:Speriolin isoform X4 n=1 Tax=Acinonyx jubatus TaxID=32536 RepID=A0ABM3NX76_ACIJB|nr:speriolin isoform X4 [Acinonyx jubatus]